MRPYPLHKRTQSSYNSPNLASTLRSLISTGPPTIMQNTDSIGFSNTAFIFSHYKVTMPAESDRRRRLRQMFDAAFMSLVVGEEAGKGTRKVGTSSCLSTSILLFETILGTFLLCIRCRLIETNSWRARLVFGERGTRFNSTKFQTLDHKIEMNKAGFKKIICIEVEINSTEWSRYSSC